MCGHWKIILGSFTSFLIAFLLIKFTSVPYVQDIVYRSSKLLWILCKKLPAIQDCEGWNQFKLFLEVLKLSNN